MRLFLMRLINNFKFSCIIWILFILSGAFATAQESPVWERSTLKDSVTALLSKYQVLYNQLNYQTDSLVEWNFVHLFSNLKVQVVNELDENSKISKISIDEFIVKVAELFPDGLTLNLDLARLSMDQPKYDRNNRYIIRIRVNRLLNGVSGGRVLASSQRIIFQIAFYNKNNTPGNFAIYGMDLPPKGQSFITASFSPASTDFVNSTFDSDERLNLNRGTGYKGGILYSYYFSDHWGVSSGAQFSQYSVCVILDKFDALGGFYPHLKDVRVDNDLWIFEIPLLLSARTNLSKRFEFRADFGFSLGFKVLERMGSSAINSNTGLTLTNVISDTEWIDRMNRFNLGLQGTVSLKYKLNNRMGILFGIGMSQGLSGLDDNSHSDFNNSKYLGQYNPLWGAPGKTVNQSYFINIGATMLIHEEKAK